MQKYFPPQFTGKTVNFCRLQCMDYTSLFFIILQGISTWEDMKETAKTL